MCRRFGAAGELPLHEAVATALYNKAVALGAVGRSEEAIAANDDMVMRFGAASEPALRKQVANALVNKAGVLGALGRSGEAVAICDDVIARFGAAAEPALREVAATAKSRPQGFAHVLISTRPNVCIRRRLRFPARPP